MTHWPPSNNITELRGFLGLTGYYRKFVCNYGILARPLTNLLKKGKFEWTPKDGEAFENLKKVMTTTLTLAFTQLQRAFHHWDWCLRRRNWGCPHSKRTIHNLYERSPRNIKAILVVYAKEMLAIIMVVRLWRPYLLGHKFFIKTDQRSLKYLLGQHITTPE